MVTVVIQAIQALAAQAAQAEGKEATMMMTPPAFREQVVTPGSLVT